MSHHGWQGTADSWNNQHHIGAHVKVFSNDDIGILVHRGRTTSEARIITSYVYIIDVEGLDRPVNLADVSLDVDAEIAAAPLASVTNGANTITPTNEDTRGFQGTVDEWNRRFPPRTFVFWYFNGATYPAVTIATATTRPSDMVPHVSVRFQNGDTKLVRLRDLDPRLSENRPASQPEQHPRRAIQGMAGGRQSRAEASVTASAVELAVLVRQVMPNMATQDNPTLQPKIRRIMALAASIEGVMFPSSAAGSKDMTGKRVFLDDLVPGELYRTMLPGRSEDWEYRGVSEPGMIMTQTIFGDDKIVDAAEMGLCAYGGGNGPWHPMAWTESIGVSAGAGKNLARLVEAEPGNAELPDDEEDDEE